VTEAAIELRYETAVSQADLERAAGRLGKEYPIAEAEIVNNVTLDAQAGTTSFSTMWQGIKRSSADRTEVVLFRTGGLVIGHLAPHKGWEHLLEKTQIAWAALGHATGENLALSRAGIRYINRIDIPAGSKQSAIFDYVQFQPKNPEGLISLDTMSEFHMQIVYSIPKTEFGAKIALANGLSPLIDHTAIILDIDVFCDHAIPRRTNDVWNVLSEMRVQKNIIFESCVTDKARELFDR